MIRNKNGLKATWGPRNTWPDFFLKQHIKWWKSKYILYNSRKNLYLFYLNSFVSWHLSCEVMHRTSLSQTSSKIHIRRISSTSRKVGFTKYITITVFRQILSGDFFQKEKMQLKNISFKKVFNSLSRCYGYMTYSISTHNICSKCIKAISIDNKLRPWKKVKLQSYNLEVFISRALIYTETQLFAI